MKPKLRTPGAHEKLSSRPPVSNAVGVEHEPRDLITRPLPTWQPRIPAGWILACVALIELLLWITYARTQIIGHYPGGHDQAVYLERAYAAYERLHDLGLFGGMVANLAVREPNGILLPDMAAVWFLLTGPGRIGALALNFLVFLGFQAAVALNIRTILGTWSPAVGAVALVVGASAPYLTYGGMFDFRTDFLALCGYGSACALLVGSRAFLDRRRGIEAGVVSALTIAIRFITGPYFVCFIALVALFLAWQGWTSRPGTSAHARASLRLRNLGLTSLTTLILIAPVLLLNARAIVDYYFVRWGAGAAADVVAPMPDDGRVRDALAYYAQALSDQHLGVAFLLIAMCVVVRGLIGVVRELSDQSSRIDTAPLLAIVIAAVAAPFAILALYPTRAAVLIGVTLGPIVLALVICVHATLAGFGRRLQMSSGHRLRQSRRFIDLMILALSGFTVFAHMAQRQLTPYPPADARVIDHALIQLTDRLVEQGVPLDTVVGNSLDDYTMPAALQVIAYERDQVLLPARQDLGPYWLDSLRRLAGSTEEAQAVAEASGAMILTQALQADSAPEPALSRRLRAVTPDLAAVARHELVPIGSYGLSDRTITTYVRPRPTLQGVTADGWLTASGAQLALPAWAVSRTAAVELIGTSDLDLLPSSFAITARSMDGVLPAHFSRDGASYELTIDYSHVHEPATATLVRISFSGSFRPASLGVNNDQRDLVLRVPEQIRVLTTDAGS